MEIALFILFAVFFFVIGWALIVGVIYFFLPFNHPWVVAIRRRNRKTMKE